MIRELYKIVLCKFLLLQVELNPWRKGVNLTFYEI